MRSGVLLASMCCTCCNIRGRRAACLWELYLLLTDCHAKVDSYYAWGAQLITYRFKALQKATK